MSSIEFILTQMSVVPLASPRSVQVATANSTEESQESREKSKEKAEKMNTLPCPNLYE